MTSILYRSNQEVKSSVSGCGVMWLDDYHIRLVCCSQAWPDGYDLEPIRVNGLWVPGLGQLILNAPCVFRTCTYEVPLSGDSYKAKSHAPFSYGLLTLYSWTNLPSVKISVFNDSKRITIKQITLKYIYDS